MWFVLVILTLRRVMSETPGLYHEFQIEAWLQGDLSQMRRRRKRRKRKQRTRRRKETQYPQNPKINKPSIVLAG